MTRDRKRYVAAAKEIYENNDPCNIEIDDAAKLSEADSEGGSWVAAWVWVYDSEVQRRMPEAT